MTWAVYVLGKFPDVQRKLREELRASDLPDIRDTSAQITAEQIEQVPYLHAVTNEVLRYYSPVPMTIRVAAKDVVLCGQMIPEGTTVITPLIGANHDSKMWSEDPKVFNPDRWMGPGRANTGGAESNYSNMTFSHGPRGCIGAGKCTENTAISLSINPIQVLLKPSLLPCSLHGSSGLRPRWSILT